MHPLDFPLWLLLLHFCNLLFVTLLTRSGLGTWAARRTIQFHKPGDGHLSNTEVKYEHYYSER